MNNKDFITHLANQTNLPTKTAQEYASTIALGLVEMLNDETSISIQGFGAFEIKKKLERVITNPATKKRILIPPRLILSFRPSGTLKDKMK